MPHIRPDFRIKERKKEHQKHIERKFYEKTSQDLSARELARLIARSRKDKANEAFSEQHFLPRNPLTPALFMALIACNLIPSSEALESDGLKKIDSDIGKFNPNSQNPLTTSFNPDSRKLTTPKDSKKSIIETQLLEKAEIENYKEILFQGIRSKNIETIETSIKFLKEKTGDINFTTPQGLTPLHLASKFGNFNAVKMLIDNGADFNSVDHEGLTPLHFACETFDDKIVKMLIEKGAKIKYSFKKYSGITIPETPMDVLYRNWIHKDKKRDLNMIEMTVNRSSDLLFGFIGGILIKLHGKIDSLQITKSLKEEDANGSFLDFFYYHAFSLFFANGIGNNLKNRSEQYNQKKPLNLYLRNLGFFSFKKIEPLKWEIKDNHLVLELEHQPEDLKQEICNLFSDNFPRLHEIERQEGKITIKLNQGFLKGYDDINEVKDKLNELMNKQKELEVHNNLSKFKSKLDKIMEKKDKEFEDYYGIFFGGSKESLRSQEVRSLYCNVLALKDNYDKDLMKLQMLIYSGLVEIPSIGKDIFTSNNGTILLDEDSMHDEIKGFENRMRNYKTSKNQDPIYHHWRIGIKDYNEKKYFLITSQSQKSMHLVCEIENRKIKFFLASINDKFEIQHLFEDPLKDFEVNCVFAAIRSDIEKPLTSIRQAEVKKFKKEFFLEQVS